MHYECDRRGILPAPVKHPTGKDLLEKVFKNAKTFNRFKAREGFGLQGIRARGVWKSVITQTTEGFDPAMGSFAFGGI